MSARHSAIQEPVPLPAEDASSNDRGDTYGHILKSSALIGGSSILNIAIGIVRTKAMALMLGPAGFGLFGLYGSIANLSQCLVGMGINSSGVRQIAAAVGSGDLKRVARTTIVLRRTSVLLGLLGAVLLVALSRPISTLTFGSKGNAGAIALLSVALFFQLVSNGQAALIQGMRHILNLAKMGVLGAFFGTLVSIPLVYLLRDKGVVPSLVAVAMMSLSFSWWYSRKVRVETPSMTVSQVGQEASALLKLGFAFMTSGLMTMGMAYAVRIILLRKAGMEATGYYQSAWTLGGLYVGFILQAMGADFYPRLTASAHDHLSCNRLVNEQTLVGLLLAGPGVIATLTLAPLVIALFYSAKFGAAIEVLRWICLGTMLQVITWPMSFIIVAKGKQAIYLGVELAWGAVSLVLAWICVGSFGLKGAGIAFFASYVAYGLLLLPTVRRLSGFRWSAVNMLPSLVFLSAIALVFLGFYLLPFRWATGMGIVAALLSGVYSIRTLVRLVSWEHVPGPIRKFLTGIRLVPGGGF